MLKSLFWSFLEQGGSKVVALVVQIVLARLLAPEAFGVLAIMLVLIDVANVISQGGLGTALIQKQSISDTDCNTAFALSLFIAIVLYAAIFFLAPYIAVFYQMEGLEVYLRVLSLAIPINAVNSIQRSLLQKSMNFKAIFKANLSAVAISGLLGVFLAATGFGLWALVAQVLVQALLACVVMLVQVNWTPHFEFNWQTAKGLYSYGWKICATGVLSVAYTGVSELILGKACSAADLGLYSQGRKWPNAGVSIASNALQNVMFPAFAEMQDDPVRLRAAIKKALTVGSFVIVPISSFLCVTARSLVILLLTEKWIDCVPVFQVTSLAASVLMLQLVNLRAYMALGNSALYLKLQAIKIALLCLIIWPTAVLSGDIYITACAVTICGILCVICVDLVPAKRVHGLGAIEQLAMLAPIVAIALIAAIVTWAVGLFRLHVAATLVIQLLVFASFYLFGAKLFNLPGAQDAVFALRSVLKRS